jgi:hypothetical protein
MLLILGILILIVFIGGVGAVAQRANRPISRTGTSAGGKAKSGGKTGSRASTGRKSATPGGRSGRSGGARKPSWLLKAWNSTGAPKTSETTLGGAGAVLTGKAAGAVTRGGWLVSKNTGKAGAWFAGRTLVPFDKWLAKKRAGIETAAALGANPKSRERENGKTLECPIPDEPIGGVHGPARATAATLPPVFVHSTKKSSKGASVSGSTVSGAAPSTLTAHVNYINGFEPESDADLLNMMGAEVAGKAAEAEAYQELFDRCVSGAGLDPQAMQGVSDYAEAIAESAEAMKRAHAQFVAVYGAILEATENGTVLPHDGRFFSGEANVA